ncbi:ADP-ribosylglycohydrolase family protein [Cohnella herbarum]|uniref:ADP-ribosylglycohydrolase family protein n=1 Tax=Cohnella herbarum TaxID=2728023 RepID=A0A7Z2VQU8_9BACL|nr:ADP-ribosylglycohydrolase family protein [Cohnella herbarum]QJD87460.1 ADP-ribosylglycohydrolase family protein [Cohnella herbarum]
MNVINEREYYRTIYGGWLGKNIGGTLGAPVEGKKELLKLDFYPLLPDGPLENDDLDLQLVWLHALEQYGPKLTSRELGQEWVEHIFFPFDEYGYAITNLRRGLIAPVAGSFNNPFADCMGAPIRSEIWAMVAPGAPHLAARYAYEDAIVDHAGGEGVYGEMFFAAIQSAIFVVKDRDELIRIGMTYIPETCRTAKALRDLLAWHAEGKDWLEARSLILSHHGSNNFTDAPQNIAFTILGWLYGTDFEDAVLKAVNCGYDTDCTAATLGAILGMIDGPEGLPDKWVRPVGESVVVSPPIKGFPAPRNLDELTRRTIRMGKQVLAAWDMDLIVHSELETRLGVLDLESNEAVRELWTRNVSVDHRMVTRNSLEGQGIELIVQYGDQGPSIGHGQPKTLVLALHNHTQEQWEGVLSLRLPEEWQGDSGQAFKLAPSQSMDFSFAMQSAGRLETQYELTAVIERFHDHSPWAELKESIYLVPMQEWLIREPGSDSEKVVHASGNLIEWGAESRSGSDSGEGTEGAYRARAWLINPTERSIRFNVASNVRVQATLNGKTIIDSAEGDDFMPAYHRTHERQFAEFTMPAGRHELEITAFKKRDALQVYVLPVATFETAEPGPWYYYTNMFIVADPEART